MVVSPPPLAQGNVAQNALPMSAGPALLRRSASASPFGPAATMGTSVIGSDLTILGQGITIISKNRLQIDGDIYADVAGKEVIISADGSVIGTVSAERVDVHGGVKGAIRAMTVVLHPSAQVEADILHDKLEIAEGAYLEGRVRKSRDANELKPNLDAGSHPAALGRVRCDSAA
jgi:cytoskeletal protein CcmA (bactofilin family)